VRKQTTGLFQHIEIMPAENMVRTEEVLVVKRDVNQGKN
jgi:hypothetical protein